MGGLPRLRFQLHFTHPDPATRPGLGLISPRFPMPDEYRVRSTWGFMYSVMQHNNPLPGRVRVERFAFDERENIK